MTSPLTTMGMAGGQETVGMAQTRPRASSAGTTSCGAKMASRMVHRGSFSASSRARAAKFPAVSSSAGALPSGRAVHQHEIARVGILALDAMLPQHLGQCLTGTAQRGGIQRQLERLPVRGIPG